MQGPRRKYRRKPSVAPVLEKRMDVSTYPKQHQNSALENRYKAMADWDLDFTDNKYKKATNQDFVLNKDKNGAVRDSAFNKDKNTAVRESAFNKDKNTVDRDSAFNKDKNTADRESAFKKDKNAADRESAFNKDKNAADRDFASESKYKAVADQARLLVISAANNALKAHISSSSSVFFIINGKRHFCKRYQI